MWGHGALGEYALAEPEGSKTLRASAGAFALTGKSANLTWVFTTRLSKVGFDVAYHGVVNHRLSKVGFEVAFREEEIRQPQRKAVDEDGPALARLSRRMSEAVERFRVAH